MAVPYTKACPRWLVRDMQVDGRRRGRHAMDGLERFKVAQDAEHGGFRSAIAELRAGRKRTHWIWFVFPQISGLGSSETSRRFALRGREEAEAYLRDDV